MEFSGSTPSSSNVCWAVAGSYGGGYVSSSSRRSGVNCSSGGDNDDNCGNNGHGSNSDQTSLFRSLIKSRRFDEGTLRILEALLASRDVKSLLEIRSILNSFLRSQSLLVFREITDKSAEQKLLILDFFVRAFALAGDVQSCLSLRYEALVLRELKSATYQQLHVSHSEWLTFAKQSFNCGFYTIAVKACENALACPALNPTPDVDGAGFLQTEVIDEIKKFKDAAVMATSGISVQARAAKYINRKTDEKDDEKCSTGERHFQANTLFRNGIKRRNAQKFRQHQYKRLSGN